MCMRWLPWLRCSTHAVHRIGATYVELQSIRALAMVPLVRHFFTPHGGVRTRSHRWLWRELIALLSTRAGRAPPRCSPPLPISPPSGFLCTPARACRASSCCRRAIGARPMLWSASVQAWVEKPMVELAAAVEHAGEWPAGAGEEGRCR
jgi:hypothetical protein